MLLQFSCIFSKEDKTKNMTIDERLERLFGNDEVREEEQENDKSKTEGREEEDDNKLQEGGIVRITGAQDSAI